MPFRGHAAIWSFRQNDAANLGETLPPELFGVEVGAVADNKIVLTYNENLDGGSVPATGDFSLVGSALASISSVAVLGAAVTLTLSSDIYDFEVIALSYTAGVNPIRDMFLNDAPNIVNQVVTNNGNASCTLNGETLDYSDLGLTSAQVDAHIAGLSTCTNCTITIAGTNAHRTAASNDDLNTLLANGNTITLNDVLGAELHTSLNAANDSATQAITAFSDHAATIDGATKVDSAIDFLSMIPQGATLNVSNCVNESNPSFDYTTFANGTPTGFDVTSDGSGTMVAGTADEMSFVFGKKYVAKFNMILNSGTTPRVDIKGSFLLGSGADEGFSNATNGSNVFIFTANATYTGVLSFTNSSTASNFQVTNLSVKELEVLGADLVTDGDFGGTTLAAAKGVAGITKATPGVVTFDAAHGYADGDVIKFSGLTEMTELNDEYWILRSNAGDTFELQTTVGNSLDTSGYGTAETTGGNCAQDTTLTEWSEGAGWHPGVDGAGALNGLTHCDGSQTGYSHMYQSEAMDEGWHLYKITCSNYAAGQIAFRTDSGRYEPDIITLNGIDANGTYNIFVYNDGTYDNITVSANVDFIGSIDNVSTHKLTFQKEIAASTNYTGTHYVLPVDENDFCIPVDYTIEAIVAQTFNAESNLTTGFTAANNAVLSSVDTPVNVGEFAVQCESNTTPTADADCDIDITVENAAVYRLSVDHRHIGSNGDWILEVEGVTVETLASTDVAYATKVYYFTAGDTTCTIRYKENNIGNNGGVVFDNIDLQKVTITDTTTEDLTTYTEVDPESDFTVISNKLTVTDMHTEHVTAYIYKDYTADYFSKDLEIQFEFVVTDPNNGQDTSDQFCLLSLSNILGITEDSNIGPSVHWTPKMVLNQIQLYCGDKQYATSYLTFIVGAGTVFYCTLTRVSAANPADCSVLIDVYSDSDRTIRMNKADGNPSIQYGRDDIPAADGAVEYKYVQLGTSERDSADNTAYGSYYIQNVEIISH